MRILRLLSLKEPFAELDLQISKLRLLKDEMEGVNRSYYGEYLSRLLFGQADT